MDNPLLNFTDLPPFSDIHPDHIKPAIEQAIAACKSTINEVLAQSDTPSWQNLCCPIETVEDRLNQIWSPISHMNSVVNSPELRQAYEETLPLLSEYSTWVGQNKVLYQAYQTLSQQDSFSELSQAQQKSITDALRDFQLSGIGLAENEQKRFAEISQSLSQLATAFSNNVLDATMGWFKHVDDVSQLKGLPESALAAAQAAAQAKERSGYVFTLDIPSYLPVMTYCENAALREEMYRAYNMRASELGPNAGQWDNSEIMQTILELRHELAQLLGFQHYGHLSLATKMAPSPEHVFTFLNELAEKAKPQGDKEIAALLDFAKEKFGVQSLALWDVAYYSEQYKQHLFDISDETLRPYFPEQTVLNGLFTVLEKLFNLKVREHDQASVDTWHPDVRFFDIIEPCGAVRGRFYLDLYAREHKRGGAWMDECQVRRLTPQGQHQLPVAYLTCNFNRPLADKPALFTHDEVVTLFHEFGHGIHHMLTKVEVAAVSGINGVPRDAVELPSQFLENWCWQQQALSFISGHYQTGDSLPVELLDKMLAAKNFQSAMALLRQLEFSLFDFEIHANFDPESGIDILATLAQVKQKVAVLPTVDWSRFPHTFSHIFAGGYSAGYYSYLWAEVLSCDAFSRFAEEGIFNPKTGQDFLNHILEQGGSEDPMILFERFRGRAPQTQALLDDRGIVTA